MKLKIILVLALSWCVKSADKDDDESRPYEFGFTIDGQQHRRESKDVNGIIMGEFGFITGDGVYHVTVYATDENGAFKIISMKNIKISEPLDTPGYQFGKTPTAVGGAVIATTTTTTTTTPKNNAPYDFTTEPSLNVASCSSCKIPSTTPRPPGAPNKLVFQTPAFQNKRPAEDRPNKDSFDKKRPPVNNLTPPFRSPDIPNNPKAPFDNSRNPTPPLDNSRNPIPPLDNSRNPIPPLDNSRNPIPPFDNSRNPIPPFGNSRNPIPSFNNPTNPRPIPQPSPDQQPPYSNPETGVSQINNPKEQNRSDPQPAKYQISDNEIKIPGRQSIPIKDPYPNMVNGLPDGITETDISDLLYKFNYTLGFHGHYEKGLKNGAKVGGYFVNGRDGISRVVTYVADENGYRPKVKFINLGLESENTPKEGTEKKFGLKGFEFVWYPL